MTYSTCSPTSRRAATKSRRASCNRLFQSTRTTAWVFTSADLSRRVAVVCPRTMARADTHKTLTTAVTSTIDLAARFHVMTHLRCPAAPSFHRVDVDHLNAALFHDGPGDRDFVAHLADEKR